MSRFAACARSLPVMLALIVASLPAVARDLTTDQLPENLHFKSSVNETGVLFKVLFQSGGPTYALGIGGAQYFGEHFYFGGRGWGGMVGSGGGMGFGGLLAGAGSTLGDWFQWRLEATFGGGGGSWINGGGGFFGIEPTLGAGIVFGEWSRVDLNAGYMLASNPLFSGPTVGLRIGFKSVDYDASVPYTSEGKAAREVEE